jgi:hypothetical protein
VSPVKYELGVYISDDFKLLSLSLSLSIVVIVTAVETSNLT